MLNYNLKIGLIPIRRDVANATTRKGIFSAGSAVKNKEHVVTYIKEHFTDELTTFTDLEWLNEEGLLISEKECASVRDYLFKEQVDAIFLINCNFGNEEAAGQIAKMMQLPTLLWGPQDMDFDEDGTRYTDTQCGLFAISKQLQRYHVPFSYINNCPVEAEKFAQGLKQFFSVSTMVKNFKKLTIASIGTRINPFKSVMANELELTEKFGINLKTVNLAVAGKRLWELYEEKKTALMQDVEEIKKKYRVGNHSDEELSKMLTFVYYFQEVFENMDADILTTECWTAMPVAFGVNPCLAMSVLADMGYIVTCESDIHGAVTNAILMSAARGKKPTMFGEFTTRNPKNDNSELLWHCGVFPYSAKAESEEAEILLGKPSFRARDGRYTIARFQGSEGKYRLLGGEFDTTKGPKTTGTYMWAEFADLDKLEAKLINGPYIHHMSEIYGQYASELKEFCKYIPELEFDETM